MKASVQAYTLYVTLSGEKNPAYAERKDQDQIRISQWNISITRYKCKQISFVTKASLGIPLKFGMHV